MTDGQPSSPQPVLVRIHGEEPLPTLVYLPGLHGNWRLIGAFRKALRGRVRFVEISYPPTLVWTLEEYAAAVESALAAHGINSGWLLAESFGSTVAWPMIKRKRFGALGLVLAGGFVRHPFSLEVRLAERFCGQVSFAVLVRILFGYARVARFRFRHSPETIEGIRDFVAHITDLDRQAARHRLHLVGQCDACSIAQAMEIPVYAISGLLDPVVPWYWVRRWLKQNCPALREYKVVARADHNVLGTAPTTAAEQILQWMAQPAAAATPPCTVGAFKNPNSM